MSLSKKLLHISAVLLAMTTALILIKDQFTPCLLKNASYGIPALIEKKEVNELYLGSSMFRQGLDIDELEARDESSYILSYNGNQPVLECEQLRYLIDHGVRIKRLYIDMYVYTAWREPGLEDEKLLLELDIKGKTDLYGKLLEGAMTPAKTWRMFVAGNNEMLLSWPLNYRLVNSQFKDGGSLTKTAGMDKETIEAMDVPYISGHMNELQKKAVQEMIQLAGDNGIEIVFVETPKYEKTAVNEAYLAAMKEYADILEEEEASFVVSRTTGGYLRDGDYRSMLVYDFDCSDSSYYMENVHLSYEGRLEFSKILSDIDL